jgi:hypothetical protein
VYSVLTSRIAGFAGNVSLSRRRKLNLDSEDQHLHATGTYTRVVTGASGSIGDQATVTLVVT